MIAAIEGVITDEPALITGLVSAAIVLLVAFGVPITEDQRVTILGFLGAILLLGGSLVVRSRVTPTGKVDALVATARRVGAISGPQTPTPPGS